MLVNQVSRFRSIVQDIEETLLDMAIDPRVYPGVASEAKLKSSASSPSLRARDSDSNNMIRCSTPDGGGGNVKVVVRVRGFLPRGESSSC